MLFFQSVSIFECGSYCLANPLCKVFIFNKNECQIYENIVKAIDSDEDKLCSNNGKIIQKYYYYYKDSCMA